MIQKVNTINDIRITTECLKTIQFNSYSLHSENMLCAMLTDLRAEVRVKAITIILTCREILQRYSRDTPEILQRYSRNTPEILQRYSRDTP